LKPDAGKILKSIRIPTKPEQDIKVQEYLDNLARNPGEYHLLRNNCAQVARKALAAGGIIIPPARKPYSMINNLENMGFGK